MQVTDLPKACHFLSILLRLLQVTQTYEQFHSRSTSMSYVQYI